MHNCTSCDTLAVGVLIINDNYDHDYAAFNIVQYRIKITVRSQKKKEQTAVESKRKEKSKWKLSVRLYFGYDRVRRVPSRFLFSPFLSSPMKFHLDARIQEKQFSCIASKFSNARIQEKQFSCIASKFSNFTVVARKCRHYSVKTLNLERHFIVTMKKRNPLEPSTYFIPIGGKNSEYTFLFHFLFDSHIYLIFHQRQLLFNQFGVFRSVYR